MTNEEKQRKKDEIDNINVCYCTKCMSLRIKRKESKEYILFCDSCGASAFDLDSTNIYRWIELCQERGMEHLIARKSDIYKDVQDVFKEQAVEIISEAECIANTQAGVRVSDYLYRNLFKLEQRNSTSTSDNNALNPTEKVKNQLTEKAVEQLTGKVMEQLSDCSDNNAIISTDNE